MNHISVIFRFNFLSYCDVIQSYEISFQSYDVIILVMSYEFSSGVLLFFYHTVEKFTSIFRYMGGEIEKTNYIQTK